MANYVVVTCPRCKKTVIALTRCKTRTCPYCGARIKLKGLYVGFKKAEDARAYRAKLQGF